MAEPDKSNVNNDLIIYRLDEIKGQLADFKQNYVTKTESQALKQEIIELRAEIHGIQKKNTFLNWIYPTLSAAFSTIFTLLIVAYINSKR